MGDTSDIDLDKLLGSLEKEPRNLDLINSVALGYFENYQKKTDREDYDFFKKAYDLKKTDDGYSHKLIVSH